MRERKALREIKTVREIKALRERKAFEQKFIGRLLIRDRPFVEVRQMFLFMALK